MRKLTLLILCLLSFPAPAQKSAARPESRNPQAPPSAAQPVVRYHYGDDPDGKLGWADPNFDDSSWPLAYDGQFPSPPFYSDGMVWMRTRIPVSINDHEPLAIASLSPARGPAVQEVFVNGVGVGEDGSFLPTLAPRIHPRTLVYALPAALAQPGVSAVVALRGWSPLWSRNPRYRNKVTFAIEGARMLEVAAQADWATALLALIPELLPYLLLFLLGFVVLWLSSRSRSRELLLNALWLIFIPQSFTVLALLINGFLPTSPAWLVVLIVAIGAPSFFVGVELVWTTLELRDRLFRALSHFSWIASILGFEAANLLHQASPLAKVALFCQDGGIVLLNVIGMGASLWAFFVLRRNRALAAAFALVPLANFLAFAGPSTAIRLGSISIDWVSIGFLSLGLIITSKLVGQAVKEWRKSGDLRVELNAAREVQQSLVPVVVPSVDGYEIEAAYLPASEVGGDFYQVLEQREGSALILVGDVSGKGLKAAMNGVLVIGAARTLASEQLHPGMLLNRLNCEMTGSLGGGFITCLCVHITRDGSVVIANAGHPTPYLNGIEVETQPALPLGIVPGEDYPELKLHLKPGDRLTFLSDGVIEAQRASGEIFGFERTCAISGQSARSICEAAQAFGQKDDITVLSLSLAPAGVFHP